MNQHRLQQKRRKRQAKRKDAQATARRRGESEKQQRETTIYRLGHPRSPDPMVHRGTVGRFIGRVGAMLTGEQMDPVGAPIEGATSE